MGKSDDSTSQRAIIDASSAILLIKAGLIHECCEMFHLLMTRSVFDEVTVPRQMGADGLRALAGLQPGIIVIDDPNGPAASETPPSIQRLHRGERYTLIHYLNGAARFVIIDDGKGVKACRRYGIPHVNALLLPRLLHLSKRLSAHQARSLSLRISGLGRYSAGVVAWARICAKSDLDFFLGEH